MNTEIPCELYTRLSEIPMLLAPDDKRKYFKSIHLERSGNKLFAITTNGKIAAIELIGDNEGPDEYTTIAVDPLLIAQCEKEIPFNSRMTIVANPILGFTTIKTMCGFTYPGNAMVQLPNDDHLRKWKTWLPDEMPSATFGAMFWNGSQIYALANAAPSGGVRFPEFIDVTRPVVIRDQQDENWVGLFMPTMVDGARADPATIPDWI